MKINTSRIIIGVTIIGIAVIAGQDFYHFATRYFQTLSEPINQSLIASGKQLSNKENGDIPACNQCHGIDGEGQFSAGYPRLAGLNENYLRKQLHDFARNPVNTHANIEPIARDYTRTPHIYKDITLYSQGIRNDPIMNKIAKQLSDEDINALSAYYSRLSFEATPIAVDFQSLERGADIALRGKPEYRVPRCAACHGLEGEGFGAHFPPLAGQPASYLIKQLDKWQSGERDNDHLSLMKNMANLLTAGDKINVAAYYSNRSYKTNAP